MNLEEYFKKLHDMAEQDRQRQAAKGRDKKSRPKKDETSSSGFFF